MYNQASPEDFELEEPYQQLAQKTLEDVLVEGESAQEKEQDQERISLNSMPQLVAAVLINLKRKHRTVPSLAVVERLTAKLGIAVIREVFSTSIAEVERLRRQVFEQTDQILLKKAYRGGEYELQETVGTVYRKCSLREWTAAAISDSLIDPLGLSSSTAVLLVLIAGISKSQVWVPRGWTQLANKELEHFGKYLTDEARRLTKEILGEE
jgi:hypothetical protein